MTYYLIYNNFLQIINVCVKCGRDFAGGKINSSGEVSLCNNCDPNYKEPITTIYTDGGVKWEIIGKNKKE